MRRRDILEKCLAAAVSVCLTAAAVPVGMTAAPVKAAEADMTVVLQPADQSPFHDGTFEGWGTSLCWWASRIGNNEALTDKATKAFFDKEDGLGMTIGRYNVGGGDDPTHNHITRSDSKIPGYLVLDDSGDRVYDWTADESQRNVLMKAKEYVEQGGDEMIVEGFSNSPPYMMTNSGCSSGAVNANQNNLKEDEYENFADYIATVTKHFQDEWGVTFQSYSPMNEPNTGYWGANSAKQEGCHYNPGQSQSKMLVALDQAMKAKGLDDVMIVGTDETSINTQINSLEQLTEEARAVLDRVDTHTYSGDRRAELKDAAAAAGKGLWMSEVDGANTAGRNAGEMSGALWLAQRMIDDVNGLRSSAWVLWNPIDVHQDTEFRDPNGDATEAHSLENFNFSNGYWGFGVADHQNNTLTLGKKYYAFGQFSRFIRPGYKIIGSGNSTLAAFDPETGKIVVVAVNTSDSDKTCSIDFSDFVTPGTTAKVTRTSGSMENGENWAELTPEPIENKVLSTVLKGNSVTTYEIEPEQTSDAVYFSVTSEQPMVLAGESLQMSVATDKADVEVNWSVTEEDGSETEKATIDASGMLEAAQEGVVRVTAAAKDGTMQASKTIRIVANTIVDMTSYINDGKVVLIDSTPNRDKTTTVGQALALFDGDETNTSDFRTSDAGKGAYIAFDFGKRGNIALSRVRILARWDQIDRIGGAVIQGSQDGDAWTDLTGVAEKVGTWQELPVKDIGAYRYIRLYNSANWYGNAAELELYGAVQANEYHAITLDESMVTGSEPWNNNSANAASKTVDGDYATFFDGLEEGYATIDLKKNYTIEAIGYVPRSGYEYRMRDGIFYGSQDGSDWTQLYQVPETPAYAKNMVDAEDFTDGADGQGVYRYIKYQVPSGTQNYNNNRNESYLCNIAEIELYGTEYVETPFDSYVDMAALIESGEVALIDSTSGRAQSETLKQTGYLFDGDKATNSDYRNGTSDGTGSYIIFDFGTENPISLEKAKFLCRQDRYASRSRGTVLQGANRLDGAWTDLTDPTTQNSALEIPDGTYLDTFLEEITAKDTSEYRYIRMYNSGQWYGNMAELRIYRNRPQPNTVPRITGAAVTNGKLLHTALDAVEKTVTLYVHKSADLSNLNVELTFNAASAVSEPENGSAVDLTQPVEYTLTRGQKTAKWTVQAVSCNNSIFDDLYADPDIAYLNGKYYIYPTTDGFSGWSGTQFHAFSSEDLVNWEDHGVILDVAAKGQENSVPWSTGSAWAPCIAEKDGRYYFYFCAKDNSGASKIGVATANDPAGPFTAQQEPLLTMDIVRAAGITTMSQTIDPSVFTDEDGTSYLLFGNGAAPAVVELNEDMISFKEGTMKAYTGATQFREAITVLKRDGKYHFTWSCNDTGSEDYSVNYGTSDSIYGPITFQRTILAKNPDMGIKGPGHHSIVKVPGHDQYIIAYARHKMPGDDVPASQKGYNREVCLDMLEFGSDGLMKPVTPTLEGITLDSIKEGFVPLSREGWSASANSSHSGYGPERVLDDNQGTHWHSSWDAAEMSRFDRETNPYYIQIDQKDAKTFSRFSYLPRAIGSSEGDRNGVVTKYELLGSNDESDWTKFAEGTWPYDYSVRDHSVRTATFDPVTWRYVRLVVRDNAYRQDQEEGYYASAGEINLETYVGDEAAFPLSVEKEKLQELIAQLEELESSDLKTQLTDSANAMLTNPYVVAEDIALFRENAMAVIDLQNWIDAGINANYFNRLMQILKDSDYSAGNVSRVSGLMKGFYTKGKDIDKNLVIDFAEEYDMSEEDSEKTLIDRLTEAVANAKEYISANPQKPCTMLRELVSYVDDTYQNDGGFTYPNGLDPDSCEYVVNNINYALRNLKEIDAGKLTTAMDQVKSGQPWLDTEGSKISAHGGQILHVGDTYYWYGEDNKISYATRTGVSCYSSKDLKNWKYEGLAFQAFDTEQNAKFAEEFITDTITGTQGRIERPKVIYNEKTGKYVMWMHLEKNGGYGLSLAGVAISDNPTHGFRWLHYGYPVYDRSVSYQSNQRQTYRDMNLFVDDDGTAYTVYASEENRTMYVVRLNDDYTWIDTSGMTTYSPDDDIPYNADGSDDIEDGTVVHEGLSYVDTTIRAVGSYNYKLPSFTGEQMKYNVTELQHEDGRWSRALYNGPSGNDNMREAPAPIKIGDTYVLVTSGATGWSANRVRADAAPDILGPYTKQSNNMMSGDGDFNPYSQTTCNSNTAFDSQSTCVLPLPDGRYMYMGDRWKDADYGDSLGGTGSLVKRSTYVWLPIQVSEEGILTVTWEDAWEIKSDVTYEKGDVNQDGELTAKDAQAALKAVNGSIVLTEAQKQLADMNGDEQVTLSDVLDILKKALRS